MYVPKAAHTLDCVILGVLTRQLVMGHTMEQSTKNRATGEEAAILQHTILFVGEEYDRCLMSQSRLSHDPHPILPTPTRFGGLHSTVAALDSPTSAILKPAILTTLTPPTPLHPPRLRAVVGYDWSGAVILAIL